jgi:hypothetical protein
LYLFTNEFGLSEDIDHKVFFSGVIKKVGSCL